MLTFESVSKTYRTGTAAINGLSLLLGSGIVGLLGPNGAGKTTLMQMVATLTKPSSGRILYHGSDIARDPGVMRRALGYLPQDFGVYENITAFEFVSYFAGLKGVRSRTRVMEVLEAVNLHTVARQQARTFSGGMRQRLGIAQAIVNAPEVLIVDEPTAGLDPEERIRFKTLLSTMARSSLIVLSTHIVSDIAATAGTIAVLNKGKLVRCGRPEEIIGMATGRTWETLLPSAELDRVRLQVRISSAVQHPDGLQIRYVSDAPLADSRPVQPGLEDAYLLLTRGVEA